MALGVATVALPLLALNSGYSAAAVGLLTAAAAVAQLGTRIGSGAVLRRSPDWVLILLAGGLLSASCALVAWSAAPVPFVVAEVLQGIARGCFWTGSQTHVVRGTGSSVKRLAMVNLAGSGGLLAGPAIAGILTERSIVLALSTAALIALAGMSPALVLDRLPPFSRPPGRPPGRIWRRPGVDTSCLAGVTAGAWRGLVSSYIPVILAQARHSSTTIGVLVSVANAGSVAGATLVARVNTRGVSAAVAAGTLAVGCGMVALVISAFSAPFAATALALSGLGAGALQTLGPAMAADTVHPQERGEAIAAAGAFRAAALMASPLAVSGLLVVLPMSAAIVIVAGAITVPALRARRPAGHHPQATEAM